MGIGITAGNLQYTVRDKVLAGPVALYDGLDQVFRDILVVGQQLLGIFGQAVAAIAEGGIVTKRVSI